MPPSPKGVRKIKRKSNKTARLIAVLALLGAVLLFIDIAGDYRRQRKQEDELDSIINIWAEGATEPGEDTKEAVSYEEQIQKPVETTKPVTELEPTEVETEEFPTKTTETTKEDTEETKTQPVTEPSTESVIETDISTEVAELESESREEQTQFSVETTEAVIPEELPEVAEPENPKPTEVEPEEPTTKTPEESGTTTNEVSTEVERETQPTTENSWFADIQEETETAEVKWEQSDLADYAVSGGDIVDDVYYTNHEGYMYQTDDAKGYLDCVLVIPKIGLKKGVYTGTWEEILYDLDIWMATVAQPSFLLGATHYAIYGHNHTQQSLSFNRLPELEPGDIFYLVNCKGVYVYEVDRVYSLSRTQTTNEIIKGEWSSEVCHIITCGRGANRYKQLIVEGMLQEVITIAEYQERMK